MAAESLPIGGSSVDEDATTIYSKGPVMDIRAPARKLLEEYSKIPPEEVDAQVVNLVCSSSIQGFFNYTRALALRVERSWLSHSAVSPYCTSAIPSLKSQAPSRISSYTDEIERRPVFFGNWLLFRAGDPKARVRRRTS